MFSAGSRTLRGRPPLNNFVSRSAVNATTTLRRSFTDTATKQNAGRHQQNERPENTLINTRQASKSGVPAWVYVVTFALGVGAWGSQRSITTRNDASNFLGSVNEHRPDDRKPVVKEGAVFPALDLAAANDKLKTLEGMWTSFVHRRETNVSRVDSMQLPSNSPLEDASAFGEVDVGDEENWQFWGVYDGHGGWATSRVLREHLISSVGWSLGRFRDPNDKAFPPDYVAKAMKIGFLNVDNEIMSDALEALSSSLPHAEVVSRFAPAKAGSCALLAAFDPAKAALHVACTGDSRAVLGRCQPSSTTATSMTVSYSAEPLSVDQTGFNPEEVSRINKDHPDEPDAIEAKSGRILGLAVTRAFGDHSFKWPIDAIKRAQSKYYGTAPRPKYKSPPYVTAEPEVTSTSVGSGDFLILASDGLWDHISSDHAVECVSMWLNQERQKRNDPKFLPAPVKEKKTDQMFDWDYKVGPEDFVVEDDNVATHLVKNALGGRAREVFCSVMSTQAPDSRNVRDDITVQVVFFGNPFESQKGAAKA